MSLPIRTTLEDVRAMVRYLAPKVTGATLLEARTVLDPKLLDGRKVAAFKFWSIVAQDEQERIRLSNIGRAIAKGAKSEQMAFRSIVRSIPAYNAIVERAAMQHEDSVDTTECGARWQEHFKSDIGDSDRIIKDQAVCFFHLLEGAGLGKIVPGRKGKPTRISFFANELQNYIGDYQIEQEPEVAPVETGDSSRKTELPEAPTAGEQTRSTRTSADQLGKGIFIAHGKNKKPLEQLKRILAQFHIPYLVAVDEPNLGRPISGKVREIMYSCNCAVLIFTADEQFTDKDGNTIWRPSENVVYELGATGFLYDNQIVILKEDRVDFPTNFRDIGYISFEHDQLEAKAMEVLKELVGFGIVKFST
jgi:predicted nucleotide-binding protein